MQLGLIVWFWYSGVYIKIQCEKLSAVKSVKTAESVGLAGLCPCQDIYYAYPYDCVYVCIPTMY